MSSGGELVTVGRVRWQNLFDDLESELEHELGAERIDLAAEEERLRIGRLTLRDRVRPRLAGADGEVTALELVLTDGHRLLITATALGRDWVAGETAGSGIRNQIIVPLAAVGGILIEPAQLGPSAVRTSTPEPATDLSARLGIGVVLRDLCRRRCAVDVVTRGERVHGTIDRVGRDHFDLAEHPVGEFRREPAVTRVRIVPLAAVLWVGF